MSSILTHLFPAPSFINVPTVGIDFSDSTARFVQLKEGIHGILPQRYGEVSVPAGCLQGGRIVDEKKFTAFLSQIKKEHGLKYMRVSIPESQVYSFTLPIDTEVGGDIRGAIELVLEDNIPLKIAETVFDYHILASNEKKIVLQVVAVAETVSNSYFACFKDAGLVPMSFELDGKAVARAALVPHDRGSHMIVDFGANHTSISIVTNGTPVFTSTIDFGGKLLAQSLSNELGVSAEEAERLKRRYGLSMTGEEHKNIFPVLSTAVATLKDEINKRYIYWHEHKDQYAPFPAVDTVYLCGGHSNMRGLADYLSNALKLSVVQLNPWINCVSFEKEIPSMDHEVSMSYVTAIGLALVDYLYD